MNDQNQVLTLLKVNGVNENSSRGDVESILNSTSYSNAEKKEILDLLTSKGWFKIISHTPGQTVQDLVRNSKIPPDVLISAPNLIRIPKIKINKENQFQVWLAILLTVLCIVVIFYLIKSIMSL